MYLLDTNICIHAIKRRPVGVLERIQTRLHDGLFISSLTLAELEFGVASSQQVEKNRVALLKFLTLFNLLSFEALDAIPYGQLRNDMQRTGRLIGPIDMLIAAQALRHNLILVTHNTREFERIPGLKREDWAE